eukprot:scaffold230930_cov33-Tisochrysis_lutea.AAC.5
MPSVEVVRLHSESCLQGQSPEAHIYGCKMEARKVRPRSQRWWVGACHTTKGERGLKKWRTLALLGRQP